MRKAQRLGALLCAVGVFAVAVVPTAYADAGGWPGGDNGCSAHRAPPPPSGGCHH